MRINQNLQGLRSVAVVLVILSHLGGQTFAGGYVGVDVFFVLSGYLITGSLYREFIEQGRINFLGFYARRASRLLPALLFVVVLSSIAAAALLTTDETLLLTRSLPYAVFWASNFYFSFTSFDYFDNSGGSDMFLHTWSLGVEEQFYLIWPCVLLLVLWGIKKSKKYVNRKLDVIIVALAAISIASFILSLYLSQSYPIHSYYQMPSRAWQFACGGIVFLSLLRQQEKQSEQSLGSSFHASYVIKCLAYAGITIIVFSAYWFTSYVTYPGWRALLPTLGTLIFLLGFGLNDSKSFLSKPLFVWIGDRSYSLYLWHWPVICIGLTLGLDQTSYPFLAIGVLLLSSFTYKFIELPFWKGRYSWFSASKVLISSMLMSFLIALAHYFWVAERELSDERVQTSEMLKSDLPPIYNAGCDSWYFSSEVKPCVIGKVDQENPQTMILLGDSIGAQWVTAFAEVSSKLSWNFIVLTKSACPMVDKNYFYKRIGKKFEICVEWRQKVIEHVKQLSPNVIFMGSSSVYEFDRQDWQQGTERIINKLPKSSKLVILPGTPSLGFDGPQCIVRNYDRDNAQIREVCRSKSQDEKAQKVVSYLTETASKFNHVTVLNLNDLVCENGDCSALSSNGIPVYRDGSHISNTFVLDSADKVFGRVIEILYKVDASLEDEDNK